VRIIEYFFGLIAPHDCILCGHEGAFLCQGCATTSLRPLSERCYRCLRQSTNCATCSVCRHHSVLKRVWVRTEYSEVAKRLIHALKFEYAKNVARLIAQELAAALALRQDGAKTVSAVCFAQAK
jgi:predicted amidophosphoribosyltransferase